MTKTKLYKNPDRAQPQTYKPYVPAYQIHGLEPKEIASGHIPEAQQQLTKHAPVISRDNPRVRPTPAFRVNVPFATAEAVTSPIGMGSLPNVGNNMETTWVSVDGENLHQAKLDPNHPMIDNNDDDEINYKDIPEQVREAPAQVDMSELSDEQDDVEVEYKAPSTLNLAQDEYVIVFANSIICMGTLDVVQEEVRALIFGEHKLNKTNDINPDDIIVLKRVKIKIGVFLE